MSNFVDPGLLRRTVATLCCLALTAGLTLACGDGESTSPAPAPAGEPAGASDPAPQAKLTQGELPDDYPGDLPVYPGASARTSLGIPGAAMLVTFDSEDAVGKVLDYLNQELPRSGWSVESAAANKLRATKGDRKATFSVNEGKEGGSKIAVTVTDS